MKTLILIAAGLLLLSGAYWYLGRNSSAPLSRAPEHGVCLKVEMEAAGADTAAQAESLKESLCQRFSQFGTKVFWEQIAPTQFQVYLPISGDPVIKAAEALVTHQGRLELRLVHSKSEEIIAQGSSEAGYEVLGQKGRPALKYVLSKKPEGGETGIHISEALAVRGPREGTYEIMFKLTPEGASTFGKITAENIGRQLAIVVDGELLAAPVIRGEISGGAGVISGSFSRMEATQLATLIGSPLPAPVKLLETRKF